MARVRSIGEEVLLSPGSQSAGGSRAAGCCESCVLPGCRRKGSSSKQAVEKSIALLQRTSASFFTEDGCVACHRKNLTGIAVSTAHQYGFKVDEARASEEIESVVVQWHL
jgi:hypothetical protein